jgi:glycogen operon protein
MRMDSYQVGAFPEPWRELNGKYRDTVRRFWAGEEGSTAEFAKRICGSQDIYGVTLRSALSSVNFLTSHDGFTLLDLVSYAGKHNEANGENNRDGDDHNHSVNCGVEGAADDSSVLHLRACRTRSLMATLMTSVGVPVINAGDERGRTQQGNNNAYCQDSEISWVDWSACDEQMLDFTRRIIALRRSTPELRRTHFFDGAYNPVTGLPDVVWLEGQGSLLCHDEWHDPSRTVFGAIISADPPLVFLFNRGEMPQVFKLPGDAQCRWDIVYDTARSPSFPNGAELLLQGGRHHLLKAHSLVCLRLAAGRLELPVAC